MKKLLYIPAPIFLSGFLFFSSSVVAQTNLVPNPSFEQYTSCPNNFCQIHRTIGWSAWGYSPDYFNLCGTFPASIPYNNFGNQYPATGNEYAGFWAYDDFNGSDLREYMGIQLSSPLTLNEKYYVSFKVSLSDKVRVGINKIGALFTTKSYAMDSATACTNTNTSLLPKNFAHIYTNNIITDTANWTLISGSFIADSAYKYVAIGNHFTDTNTSYVIINANPPCCFAYYYIDDIYVGTDSTESIFENDFQDAISVYPNPFSEFTMIEIPQKDFSKGELIIYDIMGKELRKLIINNHEKKIERNNLPAGIYLLKLKFNNHIYSQKLIIIN